MGPRMTVGGKGRGSSMTAHHGAAARAVPRVNLLPRAETDRRDRARLIRRWGWGLVAALAAVMVASGGAYALTLAAELRHTAAQTRTSALLAELASLQDVRQALSTETELTAFRAEAMATDLRWTDALDTVVGSLPAGVSLTGFDLTVGGTPATATSEDAPAEDAPAPGLTGSLTLESATPIDVAPAVRALRQTAGALSADAQSVTSGGEGSYVYELSLTLDQSVYTGDYAAPAGESEDAR